MKNFFVLSVDQVHGNDKLEVLDKYGSEAETTLYAICRGSDYYILKGKYFAENGLEVSSPVLNKPCSDYWTSTRVGDGVTKFYSYGRLGVNEEAVWNEDNAIRIAVKFDDIKDEISAHHIENYGKGDIKVIEYGSYPQYVLKSDEARELTKKYEDGLLKPINDSYAAWGYSNEIFYDGTERRFEKEEYPIYEYEGSYYVRAKKAVFENGFNREIWAKVEPIEWLVDEKTGICVTKKNILGGIPISRKGILLGDFDKSMVQRYLDNEFTLDVDIFKPKHNVEVEVEQEPELIDVDTKVL